MNMICVAGVDIAFKNGFELCHANGMCIAPEEALKDETFMRQSLSPLFKELGIEESAVKSVTVTPLITTPLDAEELNGIPVTDGLIIETRH